MGADSPLAATQWPLAMEESNKYQNTLLLQILKNDIPESLTSGLSLQERVGNFLADFYSVNGLVLESRKRREHLSEEDILRNKAIMESLSKGGNLIEQNFEVSRAWDSGREGGGGGVGRGGGVKLSEPELSPWGDDRVRSLSGK